jgi:sugar phosphate isomerase/epimerase
MRQDQRTDAKPRLGTMTGGFGRWVLLHKGVNNDYPTVTRAGDTMVRPGPPLEDVLPIIAEMGYAAVTICAWLGHSAHPYSIGRRLRRSLPAILDGLGLELHGLSACGGSRHSFDRFGYSTADDDERIERLRYTEECIRLAGEWGASHVQDVVGMRPPEMTEDEAWERIIEAVAHLAAVAAAHGVRYAVEPYMGVVNTAAGYLRLREEVGDDNLACVIDPSSLLAEAETSVEEICGALGRYCVAVHLKGRTAEGRMTQPGAPEDTFNIPHFWELLTAEGYSNPLIFEEYADSYPQPRNPVASAAAAIEAVASQFAD